MSPSFMRFRLDSANSASEHWVDAEREHNECKATEDMKFIQDFLVFSKLRILELVHRMCLTDPNFKDCLDIEKSVYKLVRGYYEDDSIQYPFAIEGLAIPYKISVIVENSSKDYPSKFLGSVNYSISPKGNDFETAARDDTYDWIKVVKKGGKKLNLLRSSNSMIGVLNELGFEFDAISHEDG